MKKTGLAILTFLLMCGCTESPPKSKLAGSESATSTEQKSGDRSDVADPVSDSAEVDASIDATVLLQSTLAKAKAADKRVMVHLGAPW